jgi:hypothetical protein
MLNVHCVWDGTVGLGIASVRARSNDPFDSAQGMVWLCHPDQDGRRKLLKIKELCIARRRRDAEDEGAFLRFDLCASARNSPEFQGQPTSVSS